MTTLENFAPGPLPVINAICKECGLVEVIDEAVEWDEHQAAVSPGLLTAGLVMNFLTDGPGGMHRALPVECLAVSLDRSLPDHSP